MEPRDPALPHVLLVEDDPISQAYFRAVLEALPARVDAVATGACAVARGGAVRHDLWMIDLTLPDDSGAGLLARLLQRWPQPPPALAHTADSDPRRRAAALDAGFRELLVKPISAADLGAAVRAALASQAPLPDWDNAAAARALNHDTTNMQVLRRMFLAELPDARAAVLDSARRGDATALRARLHRLQASCGLVGASRLADAVDQLRRSPESHAALERFDHAARDLAG